MTRILMVCLGNICRSPLAEGIMQSKIEEYRLVAEVDSCGTSGWHIGESPDDRSQENARKHDVDLSSLRSRKFLVSDFDDFDRIYVMDQNNHGDVLALARNEEDARKVEMLLNQSDPGSNASVPDPYYGEGDGFERVFQLVNSACEAIAVDLKRDSK